MLANLIINIVKKGRVNLATSAFSQTLAHFTIYDSSATLPKVNLVVSPEFWKSEGKMSRGPRK